MDILESSRNYRELTFDEAVEFEIKTPDNWLDPDMPLRQYSTVVHKELEQYRAGHAVKPYDVLVDLLNRHPWPSFCTLLDVGASSGYYSQVLALRGIDYDYTALDFSIYYAKLAQALFKVKFIVANVIDMHELSDRSYDIVISGGVLMHTLNYVSAIREIQRVADKQIVFHRTPIATEDITRYYVKEAYGFPCLEVHFNNTEIEDLFNSNGWKIIRMEPVSWSDNEHKGHMSYLCERVR